MKSGKRILTVMIRRMIDEDPDTSYLEQEGWEERLAEYRNGEFAFLGVRAEADVQLQQNGPIQRLSSGGLWGIEDDSDKSYFAEVEADELADLKATLIAAGFSRRAIAVAFCGPNGGKILPCTCDANADSVDTCRRHGGKP